MAGGRAVAALLVGAAKKEKKNVDNAAAREETVWEEQKQLSVEVVALRTRLG